jgi:hypothetical protein
MMRDLKAARQNTAAHLANMRAEEANLVEQAELAQTKLERVVADLCAMDQTAAPVLLAVLPEDQRKHVEPLLGAIGPSEPKVAIPMKEPRLALDVPRPRMTP